MLAQLLILAHLLPPPFKLQNFSFTIAMSFKVQPLIIFPAMSSQAQQLSAVSTWAWLAIIACHRAISSTTVPLSSLPYAVKRLHSLFVPCPHHLLSNENTSTTLGSNGVYAAITIIQPHWWHCKAKWEKQEQQKDKGDEPGDDMMTASTMTWGLRRGWYGTRSQGQHGDIGIQRQQHNEATTRSSMTRWVLEEVSTTYTMSST